MRELTGRHVLAITVGAFGVIIGVNVTMAYQAISTFPGLEVENSYVASQDFDRDRAAQKALGWTLAPSYSQADHQLALRFTNSAGRPVLMADLRVLIGRTTEAKDDQVPDFVIRDGVYLASATLQRGKWMMQIEGHAPDGTLFRERRDLIVTE